MLGLDGRVLRAVWTAFLFVLVVALIYLARQRRRDFHPGDFPGASDLPRWSIASSGSLPQRVSRTLSLAIVYLALIGVALAVLIPVGAKIGEQASTLAGRLPEALKDDPLSRLPLPAWLEAWRPRMTEFITEQTTGLGDKILPLLEGHRPRHPLRARKSGGRGAHSDPQFLLSQGRAARCVTPSSNASSPAGAHWSKKSWPICIVLVAQYIRALVLLAMATFVSYSILLSAIGSSLRRSARRRRGHAGAHPGRRTADRRRS